MSLFLKLKIFLKIIKEKSNFFGSDQIRRIRKIKEIIVQTREANDIENCQGDSLNAFDQAQFIDMRNRFTLAIPRSNPTPIYNCHGLVFASRRTGISNTEEIQKIIKDDKYIEVELNNVLPGDIVLYYSLDGDIEHSGLVVSKPDRDLHLPFVCSKWGKYREMVHSATFCPYNVSLMRYYRIKE